MNLYFVIYEVRKHSKIDAFILVNSSRIEQEGKGGVYIVVNGRQIVTVINNSCLHYSPANSDTETALSE